MSALMSDVLSGRVTPGVANAVCNAGGKLLKITDMSMRYGTTNGHKRKELMLTGAIEPDGNKLE